MIFLTIMENRIDFQGSEYGIYFETPVRRETASQRARVSLICFCLIGEDLSLSHHVFASIFSREKNYPDWFDQK